MNVDFLKNNPSWVNYIYFIIPLSTVIALVYLGFRHYRTVRRDSLLSHMTLC